METNTARGALRRSGAKRLNTASARILIQEWRESGLSIHQFCRARGMSGQRLRYWMTRVADQETRAMPSASFVVVSKESFDKRTVPQDERRLCDDVIEIRVNDAYVVRVPHHVINWKDILHAMREVEE